MNKVLYIKANPKSNEDSYTFKMSEAFVEEYKSTYPDDEIITLDLYDENIKPLSLEDIGKLFSPEDNDFKKYANQFKDCDKYIFAAPFWNLSIPAILKCYIDYIVVAGITFQYTDMGPKGLLEGKTAVHIVSRGGSYSRPPFSGYEMGDKYLRTILGFLGVNKVQTITLENTGVLQENVLEKDLDKSIQRAKEIARRF